MEIHTPRKWYRCRALASCITLVLKLGRQGGAVGDGIVPRERCPARGCCGTGDAADARRIEDTAVSTVIGRTLGLGAQTSPDIRITGTAVGYRSSARLLLRLGAVHLSSFVSSTSHNTSVDRVDNCTRS
jgi:hypothetical protein